jgi:hypothetical protein
MIAADCGVQFLVHVFWVVRVMLNGVLTQTKVGKNGPLTEEKMPVRVRAAWDAILQSVVDELGV